jgi:predicted Zn-dependent protease
VPIAHQAAMEAFITYAFSCKNATKARDIAEELLKSKPNHLLALTIQMVVHAEAGRLSEAKQTAKKVINLDKNEQSPSYKTATQILATNDDQQDPEK